MALLPPRAAPETFFEWFDRAGRPMLRMAGVAIVTLWGLALVLAAFRSALTGVSMPDMSAGLAPLAIGLATPLVDLITRHREVMNGGGRTFYPANESSPTGGLVNNSALA